MDGEWCGSTAHLQELVEATETTGRLRDLLGTHAAGLKHIRARTSDQLSELLAPASSAKFCANPEPRSLGELITFNNVGMTLVRNVLQATQYTGGNCNDVMLAKKAIGTLAKDIGGQVLKKVLEILALRLLPARWAATFVKTLSTSALRKVARVGRIRAASQMFKTTLRGNVLTIISMVCVDVCVEGIAEILALTVPRYFVSRAADTRAAARQLAVRAGHTIVRHTAIMVLTSLGGALGTFIWPGKGTLIGQLVLGSLAGGWVDTCRTSAAASLAKLTRTVGSEKTDVFAFGSTIQAIAAEDSANIVELLCHVQPEKRPTAAEAMQLPFFAPAFQWKKDEHGSFVPVFQWRKDEREAAAQVPFIQTGCIRSPSHCERHVLMR